MKKQRGLLLSLLFFTALPYESNAIVIDAQSLGEQPSTSKSVEAAPAAPQRATAPSADEIRERMLKSARVSPREKAQYAKSEMVQNNLMTGIEFMAANQKKKGVTSLPSGVQYRVIRSGKTKKRPTESNKVVVRYIGNLIDGTTFDKTDDKKPSTFNVSGFRPGLREAIQLMSSGSKWEVVVPPELGYGTKGYHGVGPNAVLIYQIDLISIK